MITWNRARHPLAASFQYRVAAAMGALAAGIAALLALIDFGFPNAATALPFAMVIFVPYGALSGMLALTVGRLVPQIFSRAAKVSAKPAIGAGLVVFVVGCALTMLAAFYVDRSPFVLVAVGATALGAVGIFFQYRPRAK